MKRSGGVTAAATVLISVSAFAGMGALFAIMGVVLAQQIGPKLPAHAFVVSLVEIAVFLGVAIWGIVTGIGLLRQRRWAWFCILAIGGFLVACAVPGLLHARKLIRATTGVPTVGAGDLIFVEYLGFLFTTAIPMVLGVWWLLLFTRRKVRAQFAPGAATAFAPEHSAFAANAPYLESSEHSSPRTQLSYRRPVSLTVIAVLFLAGSAVFPLILLYPSNWRVTAMFGVILTGKPVLVVSAILAAINLVLGIGLLRLKPWARIGTGAYFVMMLANSVLTARIMGKFMDFMHERMGIPTPPMPAGFMRVMTFIGLAFGVGLNLAGLYFVMTRRAAFKPPGSASTPTGSTTPFGANPAAPR